MEEIKETLDSLEVGEEITIHFEPDIVVSGEVEQRRIEITEKVERPGVRDSMCWFVIGRSVSDRIVVLGPGNQFRVENLRNLLSIGEIINVRRR